MGLDNLLVQVGLRGSEAVPSRWGIGPASVYLRQPGVEQFARAAGVSDWEGTLKAAESRLAFCNPEMTVLAAVRPNGVPSILDYVDIESEFPGFSKEWEKQAAEPTPGSVMDFECVVTSIKEDRDGDVLHPSGAELDQHAPLLLYHLATLPVGKVVAETRRNKNRLCARCAIVDTEIGRDAATLVEFGALRISHGFMPSEYEERKNKDGDFVGYEILKFSILEISLVPIPSNTDAVIMAHSREKLCHPATKAWAKALDLERSKTLPVATVPLNTDAVDDVAFDPLDEKPFANEQPPEGFASICEFYASTKPVEG